MFAEFLKEHAMISLISPERRHLFPVFDDRQAWDAVRADWKRAVLAWTKEMSKIEWPTLLATQYLAYYRCDSRQAWEKPYFLRRRKLASILMRAALTGDEKLADDLADGLWLICEETGWAVSAHLNATDAFSGLTLQDKDNPVIDLFAAQTAMELSLVSDIMARQLDAVSPQIRARVRQEIEQRILLPFERRDDFWWMGATGRQLNNWTPWIISNIMLTASVWVDDDRRLAALMTRCMKMLDKYLTFVPEDGCCDEGPSYWGVAGASLLDCLDMIEFVTGGRAAFWDNEKVRAFLRYPAGAWIGGRWFINYADCDATPGMYGERLAHAGEKIASPELRALAGRYPSDPERTLSNTSNMWRLLNATFHPVEPIPGARPNGDQWYPSTEMRLVRRDRAVLVCRGGGNGDSHNHNDVGSIMYYLDDEPQIVDAGNMVYTRKTFSEERYTLWNIRSAYHNVPLIAGCEQAPGAYHRASDTVCLENGIQTDIAGAYPDETGVVSCLRRAEIAPNGEVTIADRITLKKEGPVEWVFMLRHEPVVDDLGLCSGKIRLTCDRPLAVTCEQIPVTDPNMSRSFPGSLYRVRFAATPALEHDARFTISPVTE